MLNGIENPYKSARDSNNDQTLLPTCLPSNTPTKSSKYCNKYVFIVIIGCILCIVYSLHTYVLSNIDHTSLVTKTDIELFRNPDIVNQLNNLRGIKEKEKSLDISAMPEEDKIDAQLKKEQLKYQQISDTIHKEKMLLDEKKTLLELKAKHEVEEARIKQDKELRENAKEQEQMEDMKALSLGSNQKTQESHENVEDTVPHAHPVNIVPEHPHDVDVADSKVETHSNAKNELAKEVGLTILDPAGTTDMEVFEGMLNAFYMGNWELK